MQVEVESEIMDFRRKENLAAQGSSQATIDEAPHMELSALHLKEGKGMKIGIIVHSQTGHTLLVGERIREKLQADGHEVQLRRMQNLEEGETKKPAAVQLDSLPETARFDALIFGAWVQAFTLCPGFTKYVEQIPDLGSENVSCFLTQQFRYKWMGGNRAMAKMKTLLEAKGAVVNSTAIINWSHKKREQQIEELAEHFTSQYKA